MSVKIERDTVRRTTGSAADFARDAGRDVSRELTREFPRDLPRDLPLRELSHELPRELSRELPRELAHDIPRDIGRDHHLPLPGTSGKHPIAEKLGTAITGGKGNAGTRGYLMVRLHLVGPPSPLDILEGDALSWITLGLTG